MFIIEKFSKPFNYSTIFPLIFYGFKS